MGFSHCDSDEHEFYTVPIYVVPACVCMFISHAIENNLHKQQCIVGHVNTMHFKNLYIYLICLQALMNVGYAHTI